MHDDDDGHDDDGHDGDDQSSIISATSLPQTTTVLIDQYQHKLGTVSAIILRHFHAWYSAPNTTMRSSTTTSTSTTTATTTTTTTAITTTITTTY